MSDETVFGVLGFIVLVAAVVVVGFVSGNALAAVLVFLAYVCMSMAGAFSFDLRNAKIGLSLGLAFLGILLLALATWLTRMQGRWLWAVVWGLGGLIVLGLGMGLAGGDKRTTRAAPPFIILGILAAVFACAGPIWLHQRIAVIPARSPADTEAVATTPDVGATEIAAVILTATRRAATETPTPDATATPESTPTPSPTPDLGATQIAEAVERATATARQGGEEIDDAPAAPPDRSDREPRGSLRDGLRAVGRFLWASIRSIWGAVYLLVLILWGMLWLGGWGGVVVPLLTLIVVMVAGWQGWPLLASLQHVFTSNPVVWMKEMMRLATSELGAAGWGIVLTSIGLAIFLAPATHVIYRVQRLYAVANRLKEVLGTNLIQKYLAGKGPEARSALVASVVSLLVGGGIPISLWIALHSIRGTDGPIQRVFLGIPDLAQPGYRLLRYALFYGLILLAGLANFASAQIQRHHKASSLLFANQNLLSVLLGTFLAALVVPAGLTLFILGHLLGTIVVSPVVYYRRKKSRGASGRAPSRHVRRPSRSSPRPAARSGAGSPSPRKPTPASERTPKPIPKPTPKPASTPVWRERGEGGSGTKPKPTPVRKPAPSTRPTPATQGAGRQLFKMSQPVVDIAVSSWDDVSAATKPDCYGLDERGYLFFVREKKLAGQHRLSLPRPLGLSCLPDGSVLVVGGEGKLVKAQWTDGDFSIENETDISRPIEGWALNPYGSMLAHVHPSVDELHGFFRGPEQDQTLATDLNAPVSVAFSANGRFVAVGCASGRTHIVDIAVRKTTTVLEPGSFAASPIKHLSAGPDGTWVIIYEANDLAIWSETGELISHRRLPSTATCLAVAGDSGAVAFGSRAGYIRVRSQDLDDEVFKDKVHTKPIQKIILDVQGETMISLDTGGAVRKVAL